jgi:putative addiction module antidote
MDTPKTLHLTNIGNSLGVILPRDVLADLGIKREAGEAIILHRCPTSGRLEMSGENPDFRRKLEALRKVMEHYDDTLRELAR